MEKLFDVAVGIDVHKKMVMCTLLKVTKSGNQKEYSKEVREFKTFRKELMTMAKWFSEEKVEVAVMESTSIYWMPIYEACEEFQINAIVVNAFHVKNVPGRKTDVADSEWLAKLVMSECIWNTHRECCE